MDKAYLLEKLEEYKDKAVEISLEDSAITLYSGLDNHWLFIEGDHVVEIKPNVTGMTLGVGLVNASESPFITTIADIEKITCIKLYAAHDMIYSITDGLEPVGTSKTLDDIKKEIETNSVLKYNSPRGFSGAEPTLDGKSYGKYQAPTVHTDIGNFSKN